jgi:hypothetical protein
MFVQQKRKDDLSLYQDNSHSSIEGLRKAKESICDSFCPDIAKIQMVLLELRWTFCTYWWALNKFVWCMFHVTFHRYVCKYKWWVVSHYLHVTLRVTSERRCVVGTQRPRLATSRVRSGCYHGEELRKFERVRRSVQWSQLDALFIKFIKN